MSRIHSPQGFSAIQRLRLGEPRCVVDPCRSGRSTGSLNQAVDSEIKFGKGLGVLICFDARGAACLAIATSNPDNPVPYHILFKSYQFLSYLSQLNLDWGYKNMCLSPENWNETMLKPSIAKRFPAEAMGPQNIFGLPCHPLEITWINHQHSSTKPSLFFQLGAYASIGSIGSIDHASLSVFCMPPSCAMELLELLEPTPWLDWSNWSSHVVICFALLLAALHVSLTKSEASGRWVMVSLMILPAVEQPYAPCMLHV